MLEHWSLVLIALHHLIFHLCFLSLSSSFCFVFVFFDPLVDSFFLLCRMLQLQAFWNNVAAQSILTAGKSQSFSKRDNNLSPRDVKIFMLL